ncbi:thioredoxin domain-containing protein [Caballeronia sp. dw_19]|uniref:thioredoxin family protein n=1 Tax=Caballeronia sp. dw_19 TaxID=2719791 RepID=UPI001BD2CB2F|nr:thioredoxin domain-containing protein [Caballeronia sp. dw_19]
MSDLIFETTDATFDIDVLQSELPVLLDFWAPWCAPCLALAPKLEALAKQYAGKLRVVKLNIDDHPETKKLFGVRSIPTLMAFAGGEVQDRASGPSILRVRVLAENAVGAFPTAPMVVEDGTVPTVTASLSFHGHPALKDACLNRLREAMLGVHDKPSNMAAGQNGRFAESLGVPEALGGAIDILYELGRRDGSLPKARLVALYEAIPIGVDLGYAQMALAHWLLYDRIWGIRRHVELGPGQALFARIFELHEQELASAAYSPNASWELLARDAIAVAGVTQPVKTYLGDSNDLPGRAAHLADLFEPVSAPLSRINVVQLLLSPPRLAARDYEAFVGWSDQEEAKLIEIKANCSREAMEATGPRVKEPPEALAEWQKEWITRLKQSLEAARELEPAFWVRADAWQDHQNKIFADFTEAATAFILTQFGQISKTS